MNHKLERYLQLLERMMHSPALSSFDGLISDLNMRLVQAEKALEQSVETKLKQKSDSMAMLLGKLDALSPLKVLSRGYSLAITKDGALLTSQKQVNAGDEILVRLNDGSINCEVKG